MLKDCGSTDFTFLTFKQNLKKYSFQGDTEKVANVLFNYSYIGHLTNNRKEVHFKFREKDWQEESFDTDEKIILHYAIRDYFFPKKY